MAASAAAAPADPAATLQLLDMIGASWMSQAISVACELELPEHLAAAPQTVAGLAAATQCAAPALERLLRGLATLGLCQALADGRYALTPLGALLCPDAPGGVRSWAIWWGRHLWPVWQELRSSVQTGRSVRAQATGRSGYAHLEADPAAAAVFNRAMVELTQLVAGAFVQRCTLDGVRRVVDIGGGYGALLLPLLDAQPQLQGVLFDLPHAVDQARARLAGTALADRCSFIAGNFFESVPGGAELYLLKSILHNWSDAEAGDILYACRRAMAPGARLAIIERALPGPQPDPLTAQAVARSDLNMMVGLGGRERSIAEYLALAEAAGLRVVRVLTLLREYTLIECMRA